MVFSPHLFILFNERLFETLENNVDCSIFADDIFCVLLLPFNDLYSEHCGTHLQLVLLLEVVYFPRKKCYYRIIEQ